MIGLRTIFSLWVPAMMLLYNGDVAAQKPATYPQVETRVDPTSGTVGEHFKLVVSATVPDLQGLQVLPLFDVQTTWTAVGQPQLDDSPRGADQTRTFTYIIVPFETGREAVPKVAITYSPKGGGTSSTVLSEALWVDVNSVLSGNGSASALREARPPAPLPVPAAVIWTGTIVILLLLLLLGWWLWKRYSARVKRMLGRALTPPELALKQLEALESERLIEHRKIKEFYTRLTDSIRAYLHAAYGVQATDLTSNELLRQMDELAVNEPPAQSEQFRKAAARLSELLDEGDLVKFARSIPEASRCHKALQSARDIVALTRYRFEPVEEPSRPHGNSTAVRPPGPPASSPPIPATSGQSVQPASSQSSGGL